MIKQKTAKKTKKTRSITSMPEADFVEGWQALVGEPPSIMLDDRHDMISILVQTTEIAPPYEPRASAPHGALRRRRPGP